MVKIIVENEHVTTELNGSNGELLVELAVGVADTLEGMTKDEPVEFDDILDILVKSVKFAHSLHN